MRALVPPSATLSSASSILLLSLLPALSLAFPSPEAAAAAAATAGLNSGRFARASPLRWGKRAAGGGSAEILRWGKRQPLRWGKRSVAPEEELEAEELAAVGAGVGEEATGLTRLTRAAPLR